MNKQTKRRDEVQFSSESESLDRPAWGGPRGWDSYKDKHTIQNGRFVLLKDYYVRTGGCR